MTPSEFGELGVLPKEIVSELQMVYKFFRFYVSVVVGSC
jgi:hypothetical protein